MKRTLSSIFSLLSLILVIQTFGQTKPRPKDSIPQRIDRYGFRIGLDAYRLGTGLWDKNYKGLEITADYRLTRSYYAVCELGFEQKTTPDDRINFTTKGQFIRLGFDYNLYDNWLNMDNMMYIGMRYGLSRFSHTINTYKIYNPYPYFGENNQLESGEQLSNVQAHWIEIVAGIKAEVLPRIYMGFSARLNYLVYQQSPEGFENLYIPGFNRTYGGKFGAGFNYTLSYLIPLYSKKGNQILKHTKVKKPK